MTTYRVARESGGSDWIIIATRGDGTNESLTRHSTETEAGDMADRLAAITLAKGGA
jgi:hypothetical protein